MFEQIVAARSSPLKTSLVAMAFAGAIGLLIAGTSVIVQDTAVFLARATAAAHPSPETAAPDNAGVANEARASRAPTQLSTRSPDTVFQPVVAQRPAARPGLKVAVP